MFKKILQFLIILLPWFLSNLFVSNYSYYNSLNLPFLALPNFLFAPVWTILYILIAVSIYKVIKSGKINQNYTKILLLNYVFNQLFTIIWFNLKNNFLGFVDVLLTLITALFLYIETKYIDKKASNFLLPYVIFLIYAVYLSLSVYLLNF